MKAKDYNLREGGFLKARQFYYENFAPNEKGKSYQKVHQEEIYLDLNDREARKIFNHLPNQSNDRLIEQLLTEIAKRNSEEIKLRIKNMFVAKIKSFEANAYALESKKRYWSDLVFFHVGLSDVCFQFCINFLEFNLVRERIDKQLNENALFKAKFFRDSYELAGNCVKWRENEKYIQLDVNTVVKGFNKNIENKASSLATFMDMFILAHEISHHLLNHTGRTHHFNDYLEILPRESAVWKSSTNQSYKNEFEADSFAILLLLGIDPENHKEKVKIEEQLYFEMSFGVLFTLQVLSILSKKEDISSTHPPTEERIKNAKNILNRFVSNKILNTLDDSISNYTMFINILRK